MVENWEGQKYYHKYYHLYDFLIAFIFMFMLGFFIKMLFDYNKSEKIILNLKN